MSRSSYDRAGATITREHMAVAGGGATTEYAKFRSFQKSTLRRVHAVVTTAGTATAHGFNVFHGTTSIGTISLGTNTAGVTANSGTLDQSLASLDQVSVKSLADATGEADIIYEYQVDHDAETLG